MLDGIDVSTLVGLRDRAFLGVLVYSFARVSAAVSLLRRRLLHPGAALVLSPPREGRTVQRGARPTTWLKSYVDAYLEAARIGEDRRRPLFRSCEPGRRDALQEKGHVARSVRSR